MYLTHNLDKRRLDRMALGIVYAVSALSLAGVAVFARHPERLGASPSAARVYGWMLAVAPKAQILVAFAAAALVLFRHAGGRWLGAFGAVYLVSLASELAGTTIGLPFGPYHYTDGLGLKWLGHVPVVIPLSWFYMALASYAIARDRWPNGVDRVRRAVFAASALLAWDLTLDPAMSLVTPYWIWGTAGPNYGMPLLNLAGWFVTGLALMTTLTVLRADRWLERVPTAWLLGFYGANLLLPLGLCVIAGLYGAVMATGVALIISVAVLRPPRTIRAMSELAP
jgi:putative membrane protein